MSRAAENQLRTCAPVAVLSDKWEIFRLFEFYRKASNYSTNIEYTKNGQYSNVVEFELRHIPNSSGRQALNADIVESLVLS